MKPAGKTLFLLILLLVVLDILLGVAFLIITKRIPGKTPVVQTPVIKPVQLSSIKKTQSVTPDGGIISLTDEKGTTTTLTIPKGSLTSATDITVTALSEPPFEYEGSSPPLPGVLIEPLNIHFIQPAQLSFRVGQNLNIPIHISLPPVDTNESSPAGQSNPERVEQRIPATIIYTDSGTSRTGTTVSYIPSSRSSADDGEVITPVSEGGTYSPDVQVDHDEAMNQLERILADPNVTLEQVLDAAVAAGMYDFEGLSSWAKDKLKKKVELEILALAGECSANTRPLSRFELLQWRNIAKRFSWNTEEHQFDSFLEQCKKYYSYKFVVDRSGPNYTIINTWSHSVCGYIDDSWEGIFKGEYGGGIWGGCQSGSPYYSTLAPRGGKTSFVEPALVGQGGCAPGAPCFSCSDISSQSRELIYDGRFTVSMSDYDRQPMSTITIESACP